MQAIGFNNWREMDTTHVLFLAAMFSFAVVACILYFRRHGKTEVHWGVRPRPVRAERSIQNFPKISWQRKSEFLAHVAPAGVLGGPGICGDFRMGIHILALGFGSFYCSMANRTYESKQAAMCDCGHDYATHEKSLRGKLLCVYRDPRTDEPCNCDDFMNGPSTFE
jgi:hypothetical protein